MIRMSALPISEKCGGSARLSAQHGAGRAAAMSKAFHASCADAPGSAHLVAALSPAERDEIAKWKRPVDIAVNEWCLLDYASSEKELEVGLDSWGEYASASDSDLLSLGHLDFAWVRELNGMRVAFVADIKKSIWTTPDGPDSLQLHAYGRAYAKLHNCAAYCTGIWAATEGEWLWSMDMVMLDGPTGRALWSRIAYAAQNEGEFSMGDHCKNCYARLHCPEYMLPPAAASTELAPFVGANGAVTADIAVNLLRLCKRAKDTADQVIDEIEERVRRGELHVVDNDGKEYRPIKMPGKESVNLEKLQTLLPERAREFIKVGQPYDQFRWLKAKR